ncbi:fluoride efflux transporter CrcB [Metabacillus herbersteinensis]|uniref:Fluoride-specific ion channel FluC n=1 Tax=Metabacillus herbersteinensis TaxID=283816 RepID=A0ABV6GAM6_9BACI
MIFVAIGGGLGAAARYLLGIWIASKTQSLAFPISILLINVLGCFCLGFTVSILNENDPWTLFLTTGFFGAFTTFSTFSMETVTLLQNKRFLHSLTYLFLTIAGSVSAFLFGSMIIQ